MSILLGFKRIKIQPLDENNALAGSTIIIEGKSTEGAAQEANISGLSSDPVKVYGSDIAYYISQSGTGDVSVEFKLLDVPSTAEDIILGYTTDSELKAQLVGENTTPPYCAVTIESKDTQGNVAIFGFFKGKFSKPDVELKTKEGGNIEPDGETYTYSVVESDRSDKSKGNSMIKFLGSAADATAVENLVLGIGA